MDESSTQKTPPAGESPPRPRSKVGRLIHEYGLEGLGGRLERAWTGAEGERSSLRDLADMFNRELLAAAVEDAGMERLDGEVENLYRLLTEDEISAGMRTDARGRLRRAGVDVDQLTTDFVSHQAIHTYLTKFREVEYEEETAGSRVEKARDTIQRLRSRVQVVTRDTLERLRSTGSVGLGRFEVIVNIDVYCTDCQSQYPIGDLLDRGGCECESESGERVPSE